MLNLLTSSERKISLLVLSIWLAIGATTVGFYFFLRFEIYRPNAFWGAISIVLVCVPLLYLIQSVLWRLYQGQDRVRTIGWLLIGITPLVGIGFYLVDLTIRANVREPLSHNTPMRIVATWVSSVMDIQARWQYSRRVSGKHAVLVDDGDTPEAERLVVEMDDHIQRMADLLGQQVPDIELPWVRGSLVRQSGRAILLWALCGHPKNLSELNYIDRHEVAHTLITSLGGADQDPPYVLIEGWAESQSKERDDLIRRLGNEHQFGKSYTLQELVGSNWYYTGKGPVYWEGGPIVIFLMETYGAEKFFELYSGVRHATFHQDCQAILGDSWQSIEDRFWPWLEEEFKQIEEPTKQEILEPKVELADNVDPLLWQELLESCQASGKAHWGRIPRDAAFVVEFDRVLTSAAQDRINEHSTHEVRAIFEENSFWIAENISEGTDRVLFVTPKECAIATASAGEKYRGWIRGPQFIKTVKKSAKALMYLSWEINCNLRVWLPIHPEFSRSGHYTITNLTKSNEGLNTSWNVGYTHQQENNRPSYHEYEIDPSFDWAITSSRYSYLDSNSMASKSYQRLGDAILPAKMTSHVATGEHETCDVEIRCRPLTAAEQSALRKQVEDVVQTELNTKPVSPYRMLRLIFVAVTLGCPLLGFGFLTKKPSNLAG